MSQAVITQPCNGDIHEITCHLFIYAAPGASSNFISGKSVPTPKKVWERRSHASPPCYTPVIASVENSVMSAT